MHKARHFIYYRNNIFTTTNLIPQSSKNNKITKFQKSSA